LPLICPLFVLSSSEEEEGDTDEEEYTDEDVNDDEEEPAYPLIIDPTGLFVKFLKLEYGQRFKL
jgi:hypothetical protein